MSGRTVTYLSLECIKKLFNVEKQSAIFQRTYSNSVLHKKDYISLRAEISDSCTWELKNLVQLPSLIYLLGKLSSGARQRHRHVTRAGKNSQLKLSSSL
jgi:hypothetical protein